MLSVMEHHANIVPWHFLRERQGVVLKWVDIEPDGSLDPERVLDAIGPRTKLVAVTHMSNVLGTVVDVAAICAGARAAGVPVLIDGSQAAVHSTVDVRAIGCDFYVITGHKLYGPTASGALWARPERLEEMRPFLGGGDMIREVRQDAITYADPPLQLRGRHPGDRLDDRPRRGDRLCHRARHGQHRRARADACATMPQGRLGGLNWLNLQGTAPGKGAIFSFTLDGQAHPHDISTVVDRKGVAVRAGHHCAQPLMARLGVTATCRASFGLYNTTEEVEVLVDALETCHELFA